MNALAEGATGLRQMCRINDSVNDSLGTHTVCSSTSDRTTISMTIQAEKSKKTYFFLCRSLPRYIRHAFLLPA